MNELNFMDMIDQIFDVNIKNTSTNGILTTSQVPIKKPFIIEIEGTDRSGKETQSKAIKAELENRGFSVKIIHFPRYESRSTDPIKKYLGGEYGKLDEVSAYRASLLYAQDRLDFVMTDYKEYSEKYDILIFDRWVGSNLIHQSVKSSCWDIFADYQFEYEYFKLGLPRPHITIFLDMPVDLGKKIAKNRCNKIDGKKTQDIHESNDDYMNKCYDMAHKIADRYGWETVKCYHKFGPFKKIKHIDTITYNIIDRLEPAIIQYNDFLNSN